MLRPDRREDLQSKGSPPFSVEPSSFRLPTLPPLLSQRFRCAHPTVFASGLEHDFNLLPHGPTYTRQYPSHDPRELARTVLHHRTEVREVSREKGTYLFRTRRSDARHLEILISHTIYLLLCPRFHCEVLPGRRPSDPGFNDSCQATKIQLPCVVLQDHRRAPIPEPTPPRRQYGSNHVAALIARVKAEVYTSSQSGGCD